MQHDIVKLWYDLQLVGQRTGVSTSGESPVPDATRGLPPNLAPGPMLPNEKSSASLNSATQGFLLSKELLAQHQQTLAANKESSLTGSLDIAPNPQQAMPPMIFNTLQLNTDHTLRRRPVASSVQPDKSSTAHHTQKIVVSQIAEESEP